MVLYITNSSHENKKARKAKTGLDLVLESKEMRKERKELKSAARTAILKYVVMRQVCDRKDIRKYIKQQLPNLDGRSYRIVLDKLIKSKILVLTPDLKVYHFLRH